MITDDEEKVWNDMERDKRDTDNVIYGSIDQLKKTICLFLDFTITRLDGERKTSSKETKNGELIIKI